MGLKRFRKRVKNAFHGLARGAGGFLSKTGRDIREGYRRYKDPVIIGAGALLGGILGSVVPGVGTVAGASLGAGLAGTARQTYQARQAAKDEGDYDAFDPRRRRNVFRGAGEGVVGYTTEEPATEGL